MRKLLVALVAAALAVALMVAMSGTAVAKEGKPCPHGRNDDGAPNCGKKKQPPPVVVPPGVCETADHVLLRDLFAQSPEQPPAEFEPLSTLVCIYTHEVTQEEVEAECPGGVALAGGPGGICLLPMEPEGAALALRGAL